MPSIIPTIGRKLYYQPNGDPTVQKFDGQPIDATIIYVHPKAHDDHPYLLNLMVIDHAGVIQPKTHVPLVQEGDAPPATGFYAEWMPYQKGQAAKTEVLDAQLALQQNVQSQAAADAQVTAANNPQIPQTAELPNESAPMPDSGSPQVSSSEPQPPTTSEATPTSTNGDFGSALTALKAGKKVTRAAWGEGVFIYLVPAASYPAQTGVAKETFGENAMVPYMAYLAIKRADNQVCVFSPGVDSILADDWSVL